MTIRTLATTGIALFASALPVPGPLPAQEVIDLTGRDQRMDADFEEVFGIGVLDGEDWEMLGSVRHVQFDGSGNLYIVDGLGGRAGSPDALLGSAGLRVLVFDASGNFLHEFGTSGEGPGEFNMPMGFAVMRDGTTIVSDVGHRAYQLFDADGSFLRMVRGSDDSGTNWVSGELHADPRGGGVFTGSFGSMVTFARSGDAGPAEQPMSRPVTRHGLDGEVVQPQTVAEAWLPPREEADIKLPSNMRLSGSGGGSLSSVLPGFSRPSVFEPPFLVGVLPSGGIVYSDSSTYALKITRPDAAEIDRIIQRPLRPEPVTPQIEKDHLEKQEAARREGGFAGGGIVQFRSVTTGGGNPSGASNQSFTLEMPEPVFFPEISVLRGLSTTWEGRIWVQRRGDEPQSDGPIDVVTGDGRYVGTFATGAIEMPDAFGPNGVAAFIELDEFDIARVVVRRLPAAVR